MEKKNRQVPPALSGFRYTPAEKLLPQQQILGKISEVYNRYGFSPLNTPAIEREETLFGKGSEESDKLIYRVRGGGDDNMALRFDLTVPLAHYLALNPQTEMPFRRQQLGPVWRAERAQAGRYREFQQFDADAVGSTSTMQDAEIVAMMSDSMEAIGAETLVRINNRLILDALAQSANVDTEKEKFKLMGSVDKVEKIGQEAVIKEVVGNFGEVAGVAVQAFLRVNGNSEQKLEGLGKIFPHSKEFQAGADNLLAVLKMLRGAGYGEDQVLFEQSIARGLDYYTGIIYETQLVGAEGIGSVCSGGRYDRLVHDLGGPDLPAVGTSIGVDRLCTGLEELGIMPKIPTPTNVIIANMGGDEFEVFGLAHELRTAGINTEIQMDPIKIGKQLQRAGARGIRYAVIIGPEEKAANKALIKDLATRSQTEVSMEDLQTTLSKILEK